MQPWHIVVDIVEFPNQLAQHRARLGQRCCPVEIPKRRKATMMTDDAAGIAVVDLAFAVNGNPILADVDADQIDPVVVLIVEIQLDLAAIDRDRPADHLLTRPRLRGQAKLLQRIGNRRVIAVFGSMFDHQAHGATIGIRAIHKIGSLARSDHRAGCWPG